MEVQNSPPYSSWEKISLLFFPVAYLDSVQWIAVATGADVYGVRG